MAAVRFGRKREKRKRNLSTIPCIPLPLHYCLPDYYLPTDLPSKTPCSSYLFYLPFLSFAHLSLTVFIFNTGLIFLSLRARFNGRFQAALNSLFLYLILTLFLLSLISPTVENEPKTGKPTSRLSTERANRGSMSSLLTFCF